MRRRSVLLVLILTSPLIAADQALVTSAVASPPGVYEYTRLELPGVQVAKAVAFHPDGSYAVLLEYSDVLHIFDWESQTTTSYDFSAEPGILNWEGVSFAPDGSGAYLVAYVDIDLAKRGTVWQLDDAALRGGQTQAQIFTELLDARRSDQQFVAIEYPWVPGSPVVLAHGATVGLVYLYELDTESGTLGLLSTQLPSALCMDLAFVNNEFGLPGILVVCGINGADALYYTEVGGLWEWRADLGNNNTGNLSSVDAHSSGDYALVVDWTGRRLYRFEAGQMNALFEAPAFPVNGIWNVTFKSDGSTALVVGRAGGLPLEGTVFEYRHDEYSLVGIADVSIPAFDEVPYLATLNTYLLASAFHPHCDGGLIVGGEPPAGPSQVIVFQNSLGTSCDSATSVDEGPPLPSRLYRNHPNPFNPRTTITYSIPQSGHVELEVYDLAGRHVSTLVSEHVGAGEHQVHWNGNDDAGAQVASGVYLYQLRAGDFVETKRMVLLK